MDDEGDPTSSDPQTKKLRTVQKRYPELSFCAVHNSMATEEGCCYGVELEDPSLLRKRMCQLMSDIGDASYVKEPRLPSEFEAALDKVPTFTKQLKGLCEDLKLLARRGKILSGLATAECTCDPSRTSINGVPDVVMNNIFSFLDIISLTKAKRVSKRWNELAKSSSLRNVLYINVAQMSCGVVHLGGDSSRIADLVRGILEVAGGDDLGHVILEYQAKTPDGKGGYTELHHDHVFMQTLRCLQDNDGQCLHNARKLSFVGIRCLHLSLLNELPVSVDILILKSVGLVCAMNLLGDLTRGFKVPISYLSLSDSDTTDFLDAIMTALDGLVDPLTAEEEDGILETISLLQSARLGDSLKEFLLRREPRFMAGREDAPLRKRDITLAALRSFKPYTRRQMYASRNGFTC